MSTYAVTNPATAETVKEYPQITEDELADAIEHADAAHRASRFENGWSD
jgi:succinate-semialdehyde dehydrogenase/glutarate-semialdehyde dehydrogenase